MRYNFLWLTALFLLATPACAEENGAVDRIYKGALKAAEKVFGPEERPHKVDKNKRPQIIIKGGEIRYNGHLLQPGDTFAKWVNILGKPSRFNGSNVYTWDSLGFKIFLKDKGADGPGFTNTISTMEIFFNFKPKDPIFEHIPDSRPKKLFQGYLEIDGAGVDRTSKVWEVNSNKNMFGDPAIYGFTRDYLPTIFRAVSPPPKLDMSFYTDKNGRDGLIYSLIISN